MGESGSRGKDISWYFTCISKSTIIFLKRRDKGRESPKILFLLEEGMGREGNLGADPLPVFKEERADLGCVNYADRGSHEGALPRGLTELKTGGSLLFQSPSEARQYPKHLEQYLIHKKCLTSIC